MMNLKYKFLRLLGYKTFDEMYKELQEGNRKKISHSDTQKSAALQRALYPKNIRYPQSCDIYLCIEDAQINYVTHWMKPYTGGDKTIFPKDEEIKISDIRHTKPTSVYCQATNADKIEEFLIPQSERAQSDYNGYGLVIDTMTLNKKFKLVESDSKQKYTFG